MSRVRRSLLGFRAYAASRVRGALRSTRRLGFEVVRAHPSGSVPWKLPQSVSSSPDLQRVVSMSLYGSKPLYLVGARESVLCYGELFPGWTTLIYVGDSVPAEVVSELRTFPHCRIVRMHGLPEDASAMYWRFLAAGIPDVEAVIFRDADCRPSRRERAAVDEWLATGRVLHIMRDHPNHTEPILGGLWGIRGGGLRDVADRISAYGPDRRFGSDQRFLRAVVYPDLIHDALVHQDIAIFPDPPGTQQRAFPTTREGSRFVGQGFTETGAVRSGHSLPASWHRR